MSKNNGKSSLKVCLLSPHPMVLDEFQRLLEDSGFQITSKQLDSMLAPDLRNLELPKASVYVVDAHAARQATGALLGNILDKHSSARLLVVGDKLKEAESHALLRQGVKGILSYAEAREQLARALPQVAAGGFGCRARCFRASSIRSSAAPRDAASAPIPRANSAAASRKS